MDGWIKQGCGHHSLVGHLQVLLQSLSTAESMDICGGQSSLFFILQQLDLKKLLLPFPCPAPFSTVMFNHRFVGLLWELLKERMPKASLQVVILIFVQKSVVYFLANMYTWHQQLDGRIWGRILLSLSGVIPN